MKKTLCLLIALGMLAALGACAAAENVITLYRTKGFEYILLEDGTAEIHRYTGTGSGESGVVIPEEVDGYPVSSLGDTAFTGNIKITDVTIPKTVTHVRGNPFHYCEKLAAVHVAPGHPTLAVLDGVLFSKEDRRLIWYPMGRTETSYTVPKGIEQIGEDAFYCCTGLTQIRIPDTVTAIGSGAFAECRSLTAVTIPGGVEWIEDYTFYGCENLSDVTIPNGVTWIGKCAFEDCDSLMDVTIPESVRGIGKDAFRIFRFPRFGQDTSPVRTTFRVVPDSYAERYCEENNLYFEYIDSLEREP